MEVDILFNHRSNSNSTSDPSEDYIDSSDIGVDNISTYQGDIDSDDDIDFDHNNFYDLSSSDDNASYDDIVPDILDKKVEDVEDYY